MAKTADYSVWLDESGFAKIGRFYFVCTVEGVSGGSRHNLGVAGEARALVLGQRLQALAEANAWALITARQEWAVRTAAILTGVIGQDPEALIETPDFDYFAGFGQITKKLRRLLGMILDPASATVLAVSDPRVLPKLAQLWKAPAPDPLQLVPGSLWELKDGLLIRLEV